MPLFKYANLLSRVVRKNVADGKTGAAIVEFPVNGDGSVNTGALLTVIPRKLKSLTKLGTQTGNDGGILGFLWNGAAKFVGFIGGIINGIAFSATAIWGWLTGVITRLKSFNWNASDAELNQMMEAQNLALASLWGGVLGNGFGWIAGIAVGYGVAYLCPVIGGATLARTIATKAGKEAVEELLPQFGNALRQTAGALANNAAISVYMSYRNLLKKAPIGFLNTVFGEETAKFIKNIWGVKGGPDMSFNHQMDDFVESIDNKFIQEFVEEFFDEAWDGFTEAGFVVAHEIDEAYAHNKEAQKGILGPERVIEVTPDRAADEEKFPIVKVPQKLAFATVQQAITTARLIGNRDLGNLLGYPEESQGFPSPLLRQLMVVFRSRPNPPWRELTGKRCREASYAIPDAKIGLTWEEIKAACDPYNWGKFRATAHLNNRRQMAVYGATAEEAKAKLRQLMRLSTSQIVSLTVTEEEDRPVRLKKTTTRMYPAYASLLARKSSIDAEGRVTLDDRTYDEKVHRFPLWVDSEPRQMPPLQ